VPVSRRGYRVGPADLAERAKSLSLEHTSSPCSIGSAARCVADDVPLSWYRVIRSARMRACRGLPVSSSKLSAKPAGLRRRRYHANFCCWPSPIHSHRQYSDTRSFRLYSESCPVNIRSVDQWSVSGTVPESVSAGHGSPGVRHWRLESAVVLPVGEKAVTDLCFLAAAAALPPPLPATLFR